MPPAANAPGRFRTAYRKDEQMRRLLRKPFGSHGKVHEITPSSAGWRYVGFSLWRLRAGETVAEATGDREVILVMVEGKARLSAAGRDWGVLGERMDVFEKTPPHCLYLPNGAEWKATAETDCVIAVCSAPGKGGHEARRIGPDGITLAERGKGTNTRYINNIAMENEDYCDSLLVTEVFTPGGPLVLLSEPPPRRGRLPPHHLPRGDLLSPAESGRRVWHPAGLHRRRNAGRDDGGQRTATSCWCPGATIPAARPMASRCTT